MSDDPIDYSRCSLAELRDVAGHIDRLRFPERARRVDEEIRRRGRLPIHEQEPAEFIGGARWGDSMYFARTATWPFAKLLVSARELILEISVLFINERFVFSPEHVSSILDRRVLFSRSFVIDHKRLDYPPVVMFFSRQPDLLRQALVERLWLVKGPGLFSVSADVHDA
ncbi:MAG: hypothetical protein QOC81_4272 [Thermoanaerobaculia bacterium]|jgi:hypothetical protein|nr:hypothetical protein [Thermoanaerobaculia bacterium]